MRRAPRRRVWEGDLRRGAVLADAGGSARRQSSLSSFLEKSATSLVRKFPSWLSESSEVVSLAWEVSSLVVVEDSSLSSSFETPLTT